MSSASEDEVVTVSALNPGLDNSPRYHSRRKSREMWARTTSTGSFVMTNPLALLDDSGNLTDPVDMDPQERDAFGKLSLEEQIKSLLVRNNSGTANNTSGGIVVGGGSSSDSVLGMHGRRDGSEETAGWRSEEEEAIEEERLKGGMSRQSSQSSVSAAHGALSNSSSASNSAASPGNGGHMPTFSSHSAAKATVRASAVKNYKKLLAESSFNGDQPIQRVSVVGDDEKRRFSVMAQASWTVHKGFRNAEEKSSQQDSVERTKINGKNVVFSGTIPALVGVFMGVEEVDTEYLQEFLFTYRFFMTATDLLQSLVHKHWETDPQEKKAQAPANDQSQQQETEEWSHFRRLRVINLLRKWLQYHPGDFPKGSESEAILQKFIASNLDSEKEGKYVQTLKVILEKSLLPGMIPRLMTQQSFDTKVDSKERMKLNSISFVQFKPESMAEQLTLIEWQLFADIQESEVFDQISDSDENAGERLIRMAKWIEKMHLWIATEVCMAPALKDRISVIKRFILMARYCQEMNNFNGMFEIVRGLSLAPVQRLTKTWTAVPPKYKLIWQELFYATSRSNEYQVYHTALAEAAKIKLPAVPSLTILLEDFFSEYEKLNTFLDEQKTKVNFLKFHNIGQLMMLMRQCQETKYSFKMVESEMKWLQNSTVVMELNDISRLSERCEPS